MDDDRHFSGAGAFEGEQEKRDPADTALGIVGLGTAERRRESSMI